MGSESERYSTAVEDYLKVIYAFEEREEGKITTTRLAERLGVSASSVSGMVRKLCQLDLLEHARYGTIEFTDTGRRVALGVVRRHRLIELYLVSELGYSWDEVHDEAEVLEHALSEELEELIATKLGNPTVDPHGDPIPSRELELAETDAPLLAELEPGERATFVRVSDADPEMLRFLGERNIVPGTGLELVERQPFDGPLFVRAGEDVHVLGATLARAMRVEREKIA